MMTDIGYHVDGDYLAGVLKVFVATGREVISHRALYFVWTIPNGTARPART